MLAIIGSDGFIGSHVIKKAIEQGIEVVPVMFEQEGNGLKFYMFLESGILKQVQKMIIVAGNSNHEFARINFMAALEKDIGYLLELDKRDWNADVVFLSSAAVYYGHEGKVDESAPLEPDDYYGLSKLYAEYMMRKLMKNRTGKLLIFRLTNAFGISERRKRLFDKVIESLRSGTELTIHGSGTSYFNPLRVEKVAEIVLRSFECFDRLVFDKVEIVNLGSIRDVRVVDIVRYLEERYGLRWRFGGEESAPVKFRTSTLKLKSMCEQLGVKLNDVYEEVDDFIREFVNKKVNKDGSA